MTMTFSQRPASLADLGWLERLKERAMRAELEALGRWEPQRSRGRIEDALKTADVRIIRVDNASVGSIAWTRTMAGWKLSLFYLDPSVRGRGLGSSVLTQGLMEHPGSVELETLVGSRSRALYERFGFKYVRTHGIDDSLLLRR
ncbi:GNAT family N-acetyltransferase [Galactobacter valiniphilus]|uniref:GNAT family N-acetyltransferase n=1 Tax=Galactobacter valiniphilus TaxID=2676122 RepID=UPI0037352ACF